MALRDHVLGTKFGYQAFRSVIRADRGMQKVLTDYLPVLPGQTVMDLGCGTGDLANLLPADVKYVGIDHNSGYLNGVKSNANVRFISADLSHLGQLDLPQVEAAVAIGVLHHLDDATVSGLLNDVRRFIPGGVLLTVDPVFVPEQRSVTRVMMALDRGRHVRQFEHYKSLVADHGYTVETHIRTDILPFPYTHCVMCLKPN